MNDADAAMYQAKAGGKARHVRSLLTSSRH